MTPTARFNLLAPAPVVAQRAKRHTLHGHSRPDPYHWLRRLKDPAVIANLEAENAYAEAVMAPTEALQEKLYTEMLSRILETDLSVPVKYGEWMYYSRTEAGQAYAIHARRRIAEAGWQNSPEEVLLNENTEAAGKPYYELGDFSLSPGGRYLAWAEDVRGNRQFRLRVRDLHTSRMIRLGKESRRERITSMVWAEDEDRTLFYTVEDPVTQRSHELWRHVLGESADTLILTERDERFSLSLIKTRSRGYLVLTSGSHTTNELRLLPADQPHARWRLFARRRAGTEYEIDHHSDSLLLRVNDTGPNFRLVQVPVNDWTREHWRECWPHDDDVVLEGIDVWRDWMVASLRVNGRQNLRVSALTHDDGLRIGDSHDIAFDDPAYSIEIEDLPEWESPHLRYSLESLRTPESVFDYFPPQRRSVLLKQQPVPGFDATQYRSERIEAMATDGTRIPISLIRHRKTNIDGSAPLWLEGYGAYGIATDPWFSVTRLSLLERGWIFAIAHVRGGGEFGQRWHDGGRLANKRNSFTDYIACSEALIAQGYTRPARILANGGSAGGLLIGAVLNLRPELYGAAILEVPFVDVLSTMLDESLPLTIGEYEEWGNPQRPRDYRRLLRYSPYDNLAERPYPPIRVEAGLHDSQVMIWEAAKYVARIRSLGSARAPTLLDVNMQAGHGGASGRYDSLRETARSLAFALVAMTPT